jgi:hypothetical protein
LAASHSNIEAGTSKNLWYADDLMWIIFWEDFTCVGTSKLNGVRFDRIFLWKKHSCDFYPILVNLKNFLYNSIAYICIAMFDPGSWN